MCSHHVFVVHRGVSYDPRSTRHVQSENGDADQVITIFLITALSISWSTRANSSAARYGHVSASGSNTCRELSDPIGAIPKRGYGSFQFLGVKDIIELIIELVVFVFSVRAMRPGTSRGRLVGGFLFPNVTQAQKSAV